MIKWFGIRFAAIFALIAISYFFAKTYLPSWMQFMGWILIASLLGAAGLTVTLHQYIRLSQGGEDNPGPGKGETEQRIPSLLEILGENGKATVQTVEKPFPHLPTDNSASLNVKEVDGFKPHSLTLEDLIDRKMLKCVEDGDATVSVTVEREGEKWKIVKAKGRIRTRKTAPGPGQAELTRFMSRKREA